jgi:RNA polymerase sigma-70 factor
VRVTAARLVVDLARQSAPDRPEGEEPVFDRLPGALDLETEVIRAASRKDLSDAMKRAFARLDARDRNLLRQRYVHDLSGDKIAQMHGVHRATAFGWIEAARKALLSNIEQELGGRRGNRELLSLLGALGSRLDISLRAVMVSDDG